MNTALQLQELHQLCNCRSCVDCVIVSIQVNPTIILKLHKSTTTNTTTSSITWSFPVTWQPTASFSSVVLVAEGAVAAQPVVVACLFFLVSWPYRRCTEVLHRHLYGSSRSSSSLMIIIELAATSMKNPTRRCVYLIIFVYYTVVNMILLSSLWLLLLLSYACLSSMMIMMTSDDSRHRRSLYIVLYPLSSSILLCNVIVVSILL